MGEIDEAGGRTDHGAQSTNHESVSRVTLKAGDVFNPYKMFLFAPIPDAIMLDPELSFGAKCLYGVLARHAGENGLCFPSEATLQLELGLGSERQVRRLVKELKDHHLIDKSGPHHYVFIWQDQLGTCLRDPETMVVGIP
jgi:hypothetical protein